MATAGERPRIDIPSALTALEADIPRVLSACRASSIEDLGWRRPDRLSLLIPMHAELGGKVDHFLLRLGFQAYREWPPGAQFVNPETGLFAGAQDYCHIPRLVSSECQTHSAYPAPDGRLIQLICCSATMEFYDVLHSVVPEMVWQSSCTFLTTLRAIERAMASSYQGRF